MSRENSQRQHAHTNCICKLVLIVVITSLTAGRGYSQENDPGPYNCVIKTDMTALASGLVLFGLGNMLQLNDKNLSEEELNNLDKNDVLRFDQKATDNFSRNARFLSDDIMITSIAAPLFLLVDKRIRKDHRVFFVMTAEVLLINNGITDLSKGLIKRNRPLAYNTDAPLSERKDKGVRHSFFSGHTSNTAAMTFFGAHVISQYSQSNAVKTVAWISATGLSASVGYFRYKAGKHFVSDIVTGFVVGAAVGYLVPNMHLSDHKWKQNLSLGIAPGGLQLVYSF